jgi:sugar phosphate permease
MHTRVTAPPPLRDTGTASSPEHDTGPASPRVRRLRTTAVGLLVIAGCVNYMDRSAVSVANPLIRHDLGLSVGEMGLLLSAFAWTYGLAQLPAGILVDRLGARRMLGAGLIVWSVAQMASAFSGSLGMFMAARAALGLGESPMYTGGTSVCADWYPERERTMPVAVFNASASLGPAIAPALLTALMVAFSWRAMFVVIGVLGVLIAAAWLLVYRSPAAAGLSAAEQATVGRGEDAPAAQGSAPPLQNAGRLLRRRTTWGMTIGFFGVIYMTWLFATWLPGYLEAQRHLSVAASGALTAIPLGAGFVGALGGGLLSQRLGMLGMDPRRACRLPVIWGLLGTAAFTLGGAFASSTVLALALLSGGVLLANLASSCGWALGAVMAPPEEVGTLEAIQNIGGSLGGALAPLVTGYAVEITGSFVPALCLAAGISVVCAGVYWAMLRD